VKAHIGIKSNEAADNLAKEAAHDKEISVLDLVQNKTAKFAHHPGGSEWEYLAQRRKIARMYALHKAYTGDGTECVRGCYRLQAT
jgi:hypothetical protein